jgi:hypothetical protein
MNSIHRVGLTIAGLATAAVVSGTFVVQGYVAAQQAQAKATEQATAQATQQPTTDPTLGPETIYVNPVPTPQTIHVTQTAPPAPVAKPPVIHVIVPGPTGENEGSDD